MYPSAFHRQERQQPPQGPQRDSSVHLITASSAPRLGRIRSGRFELSLDGELARECWVAMPLAYPSVTLDVFTFLPDGFRAVIRDTSPDGVADAAVGWFIRKSAVQIRTLRGAAVTDVWRESHISAIDTEEQLFDARVEILLRAKL